MKQNVNLPDRIVVVLAVGEKYIEHDASFIVGKGMMISVVLIFFFGTAEAREAKITCCWSKHSGFLVFDMN